MNIKNYYQATIKFLDGVLKPIRITFLLYENYNL